MFLWRHLSSLCYSLNHTTYLIESPTCQAIACKRLNTDMVWKWPWCRGKVHMYSCVLITRLKTEIWHPEPLPHHPSLSETKSPLCVCQAALITVSNSKFWSCNMRNTRPPVRTAVRLRLCSNQLRQLLGYDAGSGAQEWVAKIVQ